MSDSDHLRTNTQDTVAWSFNAFHTHLVEVRFPEGSARAYKKGFDAEIASLRAREARLRPWVLIARWAGLPLEGLAFVTLLVTAFRGLPLSNPFLGLWVPVAGIVAIEVLRAILTKVDAGLDAKVHYLKEPRGPVSCADVLAVTIHVPERPDRELLMQEFADKITPLERDAFVEAFKRGETASLAVDVRQRFSATLSGHDAGNERLTLEKQ